MDDMTPMFGITEADRLRVFREDDEALAELVRITHARAIADNGKDNAAGHLDLKIRERRAAMWGYDSSVRFDMVQVTEAKRPTSFEVIRSAINRVIEQMPPAQRFAAIQKSFADYVCDARIPPAIAVVDGVAGRHIDLVVIFLHELDVGRKLDRSRRPQRQSEAPKQFFLFAVRNILRGGHVFELLLDGRGRVREHLRLRIDRRRHQGNTGGDRFIFGKILETVLFGDRLELGLVSGIGTARKYGALHHLFHYRRHVLLGGDEFLDVLLRQFDLRYRNPRRCVGREVSENNGHNHTGETKHLIHAEPLTFAHRHPLQADGNVSSRAPVASVSGGGR